MTTLVAEVIKAYRPELQVYVGQVRNESWTALSTHIVKPGQQKHEARNYLPVPLLGTSGKTFGEESHPLKAEARRYFFNQRPIKDEAWASESVEIGERLSPIELEELAARLPKHFFVQHLNAKSTFTSNPADRPDFARMLQCRPDCFRRDRLLGMKRGQPKTIVVEIADLQKYWFNIVYENYTAQLAALLELGFKIRLESKQGKHRVFADHNKISKPIWGPTSQYPNLKNGEVLAGIGPQEVYLHIEDFSQILGQLCGV